MAVCSDRVCEAIVECKVCEDLKPWMCGRKGVTFVQGSCNGLKLIGVDDVTINQGIGIDLTEGVHAYDGNGNEIEYKFIPTEIPKCAVGEHTVRYTVVGVASKMKPSICQKDRLHTPSLCGELDTLVKDRVVIITQAEPPRISGVEMITIQPSTDFDPMSGVSAVDDNGNTLEVEYDGEYTKETSGEIASFDTSLAKYMPKVEVSFEPIQDGTPWLDSSIYSEPYLFKASPMLTNEYNSEDISIVGGTIAWNQLIQNGNFANGTTRWSGSAASISASNGELTVTKNENTGAGVGYARQVGVSLIVGHKYLYTCDYKGIAGKPLVLFTNSTNSGMTTVIPTDENWHTKAVIFNVLSLPGVSAIFWLNYATTTGDNVAQFRNICYFDLTQMFGSTIADYIYSLEQANAGAGVAWFKKLFPKDYYEYNAGELISVSGLQSHDMVGFNLWDISKDNVSKALNANGEITSNNYYDTSDYIRVLPNTAYYLKDVAPSANANTSAYYDIDKNFIRIDSFGGSGVDYKTSGIRTTPSNAHYIRITHRKTSTEPCINLSWSGWRNGDYEPYEKHSYALDDSLTLRGIPKLDSQNNLYYDGDEYKADGTVSRRYAEVDLGTLTQTTAYTGSNHKTVRVTLPSSYIGFPALSVNFISEKYQVIDSTAGVGALSDPDSKDVGMYWYKNSAYPTTSVVYFVLNTGDSPSGSLVYELATPTTEVATPYTNPQAVERGGTEEFVTSNVVPVGHRTRYANIVPIEGYTEVTAQRTSVNVWDEEWEVGSLNNTTGLPTADVNNIRAKNYCPCKPNASYYFAIGASVNLRYYWFDADYNLISTNTVRNAVRVSPSNASYFKVRTTQQYGNTYKNDISINYPSTDTDYHAYQGTTHTTDLGRTVYGGTLNIVTGELVVDRAMVDLGTLTYTRTQYNSQFYYFRAVFPSIAYGISGQMANMICSAYETVITGTGNLERTGTITNFATNNLVLVRDDQYTDVQSFASAVSGVQLVYELATPQTYWLTSQQINSLVGRNNVWSGEGSVEVEYWDTMPQGTVQFLDGVYNITYTAEDECGNKTVEVRTIVVGDGNKVCKARACEAFIECDAQ